MSKDEIIKQDIAITAEEETNFRTEKELEIVGKEAAKYKKTCRLPVPEIRII